MICYGNLEHYPQPPTRVNIRVSFVHNSQEFHAKRVSYFAKKILFVTRKSSFAKAYETKLCKVMIACWTLNKKTPVLFIFKLSSFKSRSLLRLERVMLCWRFRTFFRTQFSKMSCNREKIRLVSQNSLFGKLVFRGR